MIRGLPQRESADINDSVRSQISTWTTTTLVSFSWAIWLITVLSTLSRCDLLDYGDYEDDRDTTVNQMLVPRSHQEDATIVLNNLLKDYDKTLRPDIGGKAGGNWAAPTYEWYWGLESTWTGCLHSMENLRRKCSACFSTIWTLRLCSGPQEGSRSSVLNLGASSGSSRECNVSTFRVDEYWCAWAYKRKL